MGPEGLVVPKQSDLYKPVLQSLSDEKEKTVDEIVKDVVQMMDLDPEVLSLESNVKNKSKVKASIEWILTDLKNKGLISLPRKGYRVITSRGMDFLANGFDIGSLGATNNPSGISESFFDHLSSMGLNYDVRVVEDFLLSLKAKQFMILSGGTGTGKTKLAKVYGEFISNREPKAIDFSVTIGKVAKSKGFTLSKDLLFRNLPQSANRLDGEYDFTIGGVHGRGDLELTPRLWFRIMDQDTADRVMGRLEELKKEGDKTTLSLTMPSVDAGSKNYLVVPVGSNWTDNHHILGYRNAINGSYSGTPSLDLIIESNRIMTQPFLLILDEMNLSHVERYFSDIISSMESCEPIILDSKGIEDVPDDVDLGGNLFIIGTVNMDETTFALSPKVLDRANVIEFEPTSVSDYLSGEDVSYEPSGDVDFLQDCLRGLECRTMSAKAILSEMRSEGNDGVVDSIASDLDSIQRCMSAMRMPFGFRTLDEVMRFMYVAWVYEGKGEFVNWKRYLDSQIKQKILPKIHGNTSISVSLKDFVKLCSDNGYTRSASKLEHMVSVLEAQRYVSFDC